HPLEVLPLLDEVLFEDERHRAVLRDLRSSGGDLHHATESADPLVTDLIAQFAVEETDADPGDVRRLLLRDAGLRVLAELERESRTTDDFAAYAQAMGWLKTQIEVVGPDAPPDELA